MGIYGIDYFTDCFGIETVCWDERRAGFNYLKESEILYGNNREPGCWNGKEQDLPKRALRKSRNNTC